jgi:hypothetical protein
MEQVSKRPVHQAYLLLRFVFIVAPILAGLDKFLDLLVDWDQFLPAFWGSWGPALMMVAGVIEVIAGVGVIFKPKLFANIVGLWLLFVILNLLVLGNYYDIALRDLGLSLSAFALGRLAKVFA